MSFEVTEACRPAQMPPTPKNVLMAIADRADHRGFAWPSLADISETTCYGRSAVWDALNWLEAAGLLVIEKRTGKNSLFTIALDRLHAFIPAKPVRQPDHYPSATRTGAKGEPVREADPHPSASRTPPVREADPTRPAGGPEPSGTTSKPSEQPSGRERASRTCPPSFALTAELVEWSMQRWPDVDLGHELEKFQNFIFHRPRTDWPRTWRSWILRGAERAAEKRQEVVGRETRVDRQIRTMEGLTGRKNRAELPPAPWTPKPVPRADVVDVEARELPLGGAR